MIGLTATQFARAGAGEKKLIAPRRRIDQRLNRVKQTGQALHLVDKNVLLFAGGRERTEALFELPRVAGEFKVGRFMGEIDRKIRIE